jgi:hypothetical protein
MIPCLIHVILLSPQPPYGQGRADPYSVIITRKFHWLFYRVKGEGTRQSGSTRLHSLKIDVMVDMPPTLTTPPRVQDLRILFTRANERGIRNLLHELRKKLCICGTGRASKSNARKRVCCNPGHVIWTLSSAINPLEMIFIDRSH